MDMLPDSACLDADPMIPIELLAPTARSTGSA